MKRLLTLPACWLACAAVHAALPPCHRNGQLEQSYVQLVESMGDIGKAIRAPDHARIVLPSTVLATGKLTHLSVSVRLPDALDQIQVLGYFEVVGSTRCLIPLVVNHIENVAKGAGPDPEQARIHFRTPGIDAVNPTLGFHQPVKLHVAAFRITNGQRGEALFGRRLSLVASNRDAATAAALLFALGCYLLTAMTVAAAGPDAGVPVRGARAALRRLAPWNLIGEGSQSALAQLQMLAFTLIVATLLFYQWLRTGLLQELSTDLLYLIGISTLGAAGSQLTSSMKKGLDPAIYDYAQQLDWFTAPVTRICRRADPASLLMTSGRFDIYKFQMLVFSLVIAAYVIAAGADELDNLHISATLLTLMGISQGAYVGGQVTADGLAVLQDQLRGMRKLQERYRFSADAQVRDELRRRFRLAAGRAAPSFGALFAREIPLWMLEMPLDADTAPASVPAEDAEPAPAMHA